VDAGQEWDEEKWREEVLAENVPPHLTRAELCEWLGRSFFATRLQQGVAIQGEAPGIWLATRLLRVRGKDGKVRPLVANRVQRSYEERRGLQNVVLKARQMGISTWVAARMFLRTILLPGTLSVQVAHNQTAAEEIFRIVQRFYANLPEELRKGVFRCSRDNKRQMVFTHIDSEYRVESAADVNAGRGLTIQNLHCSEVARWPRDAAATLAGLQAALAPLGELVIESTPMGAAGCFYRTWNEGAMVKHFFPWWWEGSYVGAAVPATDWTEEEGKLAAEHGWTPAQVGFRRQLQSQMRGMARQEFAEDAESCFLASGDCVLDSVCIERRLREVTGPLQTLENGKLWIWYRAQAGRSYVIGVDPAGGGAEGDYSALQVIDKETGLQCAEWQARMPVRETAGVVRRVAGLYPGSTVAVERNNHGSGLLAHLQDGKDGKLDIYEHNGIAGWPTTLLTRPAMVERVGIALEEGMFQSERLLRECRTFVRLRNGRTGAAAGSHDDCVMAMAVALSVRAELQEAGTKKKGGGR
jgi:hypothetical protein